MLSPIYIPNTEKMTAKHTKISINPKETPLTVTEKNIAKINPAQVTVIAVISKNTRLVIHPSFTPFLYKKIARLPALASTRTTSSRKKTPVR